jgi:hypothetical protein
LRSAYGPSGGGLGLTCDVRRGSPPDYYSGCVTRRARIAWFGSAAALIIAGIVCAVVIGGTTGQVVAMAAIGLGLVLALSLVFFEVGLSEEHARAREDRQRARLAKRRATNLANPAGATRSIRRTRLERSRGHRHRLR